MDYKDFILQNKNKEAHFWFKAKQNLIFNLLNSIFPKNANQNILDIGCGTGAELEILKNFGNVTALDKEKNSLNLAKKYGVKILEGDIEKIELPNNYYDAICCFDVLEHLINDEKVIKKIYYSLKKDGYLFFTAPACPVLFGPHDIALEHFRRYKKNNLRDKLISAGLTVKKIGCWNFLLFPLIFILRIVKKIFSFLFPKKIFKSEARPLNRSLNSLLTIILNFENKLIAGGINLPVGLTIYGIAKKEK